MKQWEMRQKKTERFFIGIPYQGGLTWEEVREFNASFVDRYGYLMSQGEDLTALWEREIELYENKVWFFSMNAVYDSVDGGLQAAVIAFTGGDRIVVRYFDGENETDFETIMERDSESEFFTVVKDGVEYMFRADTIEEFVNEQQQ